MSDENLLMGFIVVKGGFVLLKIQSSRKFRGVLFEKWARDDKILCCWKFIE